MKYFIAVLVVACFSAQAQAVALKDGEITKQIEQQQQQQSLQQFNGQQGHHGVDAADLESLRVRKAAYGGGASIPAPPCPKNYLFSCQPSLKPLPCAAPPPSYQGAYSSVVPVVHAHPEQQQLYLDQY